GIDEVNSDNLDYIKVVIEVGYWRKANAIHRWFVENVQDGNDDCERYYVPREKLKELKDLCQEVIKKSKLIDGKTVNGYRMDAKRGTVETITIPAKVIANPEIAEELLPTESGFFFGSVEYDEYYIRHLKDTIEIIDRALKLPEDIWSIYYRSSW
ncbi:MAG: hypothetical protein DRH15_05655, partial [Deltaproteobacteria bacterium]